MNKPKVLAENMIFKDFFGELCNTHSCYHSKVISDKFNIPSSLQNNIDNYGHYIDTFEALVKNKLLIWSPKGYSVYKMYFKYILPTSVFLHYLNVDISKMKEISLFIVDSETYQRYRHNVGGEYSDQFAKPNKTKMHLVLVKDYKDVRIKWKDVSLVSLFHELMHLVDNLDFNGLNDASNIDYTYRWHEIKAKYISELFYGLYKLIKTIKLKHNKSRLLSVWVDDLRQSLYKITDSIENISFYNHEIIDLELSVEKRSSEVIIELSKKNQSYYRSLKCINQINNVFNDIEQIK